MAFHRHLIAIQSSLSKQTGFSSKIVSYWLASSFLITIIFLYYLLLAFWDNKLLFRQNQVS
jgi:hypothetical protein